MTERHGQRILGIGNLGLRVVAAFLVVALATILVDVVITTVTGTTEFDRFVRQQEVSAAQTAAVAAGVAYDHTGWRDGALNPVLSGLERTGASLRITDSAGRPVASSPGFSATPATPSSQAPIYAAGRRVGSVMVKFDRSGIAAGAARLEAERWRWRTSAAGIAVLIALIVSVLVSRRITGPVDKVLAMMRARSAGDRDFRIGDVRAPGELGELLAGYNDAAEAFDQQERAQRNLVADVAHELRTPVAVLQAGHEAMLDGITEPTPENLGSLRDEVLRLSRSLEDLRVLAAAEAAALQLRVQPHDLADVAAGAAAALADPFDVAGVKLSRQVSSAPVLCDSDRMREVITNLLTNALKYTPAGGEVLLEAGPGSGGRAMLRVTDTGVGIEADELPHVAERFFRGQRSHQMAAGSGLGLTIVAELVRAHHGDLDIRSQPGQGTRVTITLPLTGPAAGRAEGDGRHHRHPLPRPVRRARAEGPGDDGVRARQSLPADAPRVPDSPAPFSTESAQEGNPGFTGRREAGAKPRRPGGHSMTMTIRETFDKSTTAFNAHDIDGFADLIAEDAVFRAPGGMSGTGKRACVEFFSAWLSAFPDAHAAVRDVYVCGDMAVEEGTFAGTHEGVLHSPAGDIQPTGSRVAIDYMQAIRVRDGKQAAFDLIYDRLQLLEQLGLSPVPA